MPPRRPLGFPTPRIPRGHRVYRVPGFLYSCPNMAPPPSTYLSASECWSPLWVQGRRHIRLRERGWGEWNPIPTKGQTLWYFRYTLRPGDARSQHLSVAPGYSQSRSRPSKPLSASRSTADLMKRRRDSGEDDICEYFLPPSFQPPMASITRSAGFSDFSATADL